jgi:hypothetical protein
LRSGRRSAKSTPCANICRASRAGVSRACASGEARDDRDFGRAGRRSFSDRVGTDRARSDDPSDARAIDRKV